MSVCQIFNYTYFCLDLKILLALTTVVESWVSGISAIAKMQGCDVTLHAVRNTGGEVVGESNS